MIQIKVIPFLYAPEKRLTGFGSVGKWILFLFSSCVTQITINPIRDQLI